MNHREDEYGGDLEGRTLFPRRVLAAVREAMGEERSSASVFPATRWSRTGSARSMPRPSPSGSQRLEMSTMSALPPGNNTRKMARVDHWPPTPAPSAPSATSPGGERGSVYRCDGRTGDDAGIGRRDSCRRRRRLVGMVRAHIADAQLLTKSSIFAPHSSALHRRQCMHQFASRSQAPDLHGQPGTRPATQHDRPADRRGALGGVVGAGPAGLEAARRLALRGFARRLLEAEDGIGGQCTVVGTPRVGVRQVIRWWGDELERLEVACGWAKKPRRPGPCFSRRSFCLLRARR